MGSTLKGDSQTTQASPWKPQGKELEKLFDQAQFLLQPYTAPRTFPSSRVAPQTTDQLQAQDLLRSNAPSLQGQGQSALQSQRQLFGASDVGNNPIVADAIQASLNPLARQFTDVILPSLKIGVNDAGSSSRQGVLEANATRGFQETSSDLIGQLMGNFYNQGLDAQAKGLALSPQVSQLVNSGAQNLANVGDANQMFAQQVLNDEASRFDTRENQQLINLMNFRNLITGGFGGTTTSPTGTAQPSRLGGAIGTGMTVGGSTQNPYAGLAAGIGQFILSD